MGQSADLMWLRMSLTSSNTPSTFLGTEWSAHCRKWYWVSWRTVDSDSCHSSMHNNSHALHYTMHYAIHHMHITQHGVWISNHTISNWWNKDVYTYIYTSLFHQIMVAVNFSSRTFSGQISTKLHFFSSLAGGLLFTCCVQRSVDAVQTKQCTQPQKCSSNHMNARRELHKL